MRNFMPDQVIKHTLVRDTPIGEIQRALNQVETGGVEITNLDRDILFREKAGEDCLAVVHLRGI